MLRKLQEGRCGTMSENVDCMIHNVVTTQQTVTYLKPDVLQYTTFLVCMEIGIVASRCQLADARALGQVITEKRQLVLRKRSTTHRE